MFYSTNGFLVNPDEREARFLRTEESQPYIKTGCKYHKNKKILLFSCVYVDVVLYL